MTKPTLTEKTASLAWLRCGGLCESCRQTGHVWHHIFPQGKYPGLVDELDNIVGLCNRCHERHHTATERLSRRLCERAERFADEPMLTYLERTYLGLEQAA